MATMRAASTSVMAIAVALALAGGACKGKTEGKPPAAGQVGKAPAVTPAGSVAADAQDAVAPEKASAGGAGDGTAEAKQPSAGSGQSATGVQTIEASAEVVQPSLVWTGTGLVAVWLEVVAPADHDGGFDPGDGSLSLEGMESFDVLMADVDATSGAIGKPVRLEGAGAGPKKLSGPVFTRPAWSEGTLAIGWSLYNDTVEGAPAARFVVGRWYPDGTPAAGPVVLAKDSYHHMHSLDGVEGPKLALFATGEGLVMAWASEQPSRVSGCKCECGDLDSVAYATMAKDGTHEVSYECANVMTGFDVQRFGEGLLVRMDNEHPGYHTWIRCFSGAHCQGDYYSGNPLKEMIVTGGGAALWYDVIGDEDATVGHCVEIMYASPAGKHVECARPRSRALEWTDSGLAVVIEAKSGERYELPFQPGDPLPVAMLVSALAKKAPVKQALWTGSSIAAVWSKSKKLQVAVMDRGDLTTGEEAQ